MKAKSIKGGSAEEVQKALNEAMLDGFKPTLAIIFISIKQDIKAVCDIFDNLNISIFGATSSGEIYDDAASHQSISILLMDLDPAYFQLLYGEYGEKVPEELAKELTIKAQSCFVHPAYIVSNSIANIADLDVGEKMLKAILEVTGDEAEVWGGGAGDDLIFKETFVFTNGQCGNRALLLLVLNSEKVVVKGLTATGLKPAGTEKTITKADGKWIIEIDDQPAAEFITRFLGITLKPEDYKDWSVTNLYMGLYRGNADPVIRSATGFNRENKAISVSGTVKENDRVRLMLPPDFEIIDELNNQALVFRKNEMVEADAMLMFSCVGRLDVLGPLIDDELKAIRSVFNTPMTGFFSYGEYGRTSGGQNEFHNMSCCWVALKEK
ncbi:MAG TPA: FIST N-terminal domain-containing protein [Chitinophagaceae bacterium]|nr:FIST C-terminal domain-containing protein [Chitinophagaceae bacterium]MCB9054487.1 FIST C-terminal domain-containing protein [Chitinophagales bacterium]HPG11742.1 FIST N-terminal domain-containing protein [Chitinophagaceae bacterium]